MTGARMEAGGPVAAVLGAPSTAYTRTLLDAVPRLRAGVPA